MITLHGDQKLCLYSEHILQFLSFTFFAMHSFLQRNSSIYVVLLGLEDQVTVCNSLTSE